MAWVSAWSGLIAIASAYNVVAIGPFDIVAEPIAASTELVRFWFVVAVAGTGCVIVLSRMKRVPLLMWMTGVGGLAWAIVAVAVNTLIRALIIMSV